MPRRTSENKEVDSVSSNKVKIDKRKSTNKLKIENLECHIHDSVAEFETSEIRDKACVKGEPLIEFSGNYYCLFHLPTDEKDVETFIKLVKARFAETERKIDELEKISKTEKKTRKEDTYYDFAYVWFPERISFSHYKFRVAPDFSHATFSKSVFFEETAFEDWAYFESTNFLDSVDFSNSKFMTSPHFENANFKDNAVFFNTVFDEGANFLGAKFVSPKFNNSIFNRKAEFSYTNFEKYSSFDTTEFNGKTDFSSAKFNDFTLFVDAKFNDTCYFNHTRFSKHSETRFSSASFSKDAYFVESIFRENVRFAYVKFDTNSNIFFRNSIFRKDVEFQGCIVKGYLTFDKLRLGKDCILDFSDSAFENALKVSFHTVKLNPTWFINADAHKLIFTNVFWEESELSKLDSQLASLEERKVQYPKPLYKITCRQLAENAENNNRFEEASKFRQMAFECERLERKERISKWWNELISRKRFFRKIPEKIKTFPFDIIHWAYRWTSFYGESWSWALGILLSLILVIFPIIYTQINFQTCSKDRPIATSLTLCESKDEEIRKNCTCSTDQITFTNAIVQSLTTATLQNVEYRKPLTVWGELWIILEKIFAPLQAALLALAIRRKFMR
jgi:uncharacterized protein YjbI with pentapeptide repeats